MAELHQPYSEIIKMPSLVLRGVIEAYVEAKQKAHEAHTDIKPKSSDEVVSDEDLSTEMWFKNE